MNQVRDIRSDLALLSWNERCPRTSENQYVRGARSFTRRMSLLRDSQDSIDIPATEMDM